MKLTKENFFNEMKDKYPEAMGVFCKWIDEYKTEVGWDKLFSPPRDPRIFGIKFHDIPFEMQNGIIARFELEFFNNTDGNGKVHYKQIAKDYRAQVEHVFIDLQKNIVRRQKKLN